jgi:predicted Zn finger-like uncharacterized protein
MTVSVKCPHCNKTYRVNDESLGRTSRCKSCGEKFSLEQAAQDTQRSQADIEPPHLRSWDVSRFARSWEPGHSRPCIRPGTRCWIVRSL